ncbi:MAG: DUF3800 domain-containing protein [Patescibacteria group bacterium]
MWYLYLDESGDLGFDFVTKRPSKFFTITILAVSSLDNNRKIIKAVKTTLRRKFNKKDGVHELKGREADLSVKKYLYKLLKGVKFSLYSMTLNKKLVYQQLTKEKSRVYNFIARKVLEQIPFEKNDNNRVELIIDKSMSKPEIIEFNSYIRRQLEARLNPKTPLDIYHWLSHENYGLQAVDIFCWGIFQKYERSKTDWYDVYEKDKIRFEDQYL